MLYRTILKISLMVVISIFCVPHALNAQNWLNFGSGKFINDIVMENDILWIATNSGLSRFNKLTEKSEFFTKADSDIPNNEIRSVALDSNGNKWFGTAYGLAKYDGTTWTTYYTYNSDLPGNMINCIEVDNKNRIWIGTENGGIAMIDNAEWTLFNKDNCLYSDTTVNCIACDGENIWFGSRRSGLYLFDGTNWTNFNTTNSELTDTEIYGIYLKKDGKIYFSSGGIYNILNDEINLVTTLDPSARGVIAEDEYGNLLYGSKYSDRSKGLQRFDGSENIEFNTNNCGIPSNNVSSILVEKDGTKWIGTYEGGLAKLSDNKWQTFEIANAILPSNKITALEVDKNNHIWIGTYSGLAEYDGKTWKQYNKANSGLSSNKIQCIAVDSNNTKWFGTVDSGLVRYNGTEWSQFTKDNSLIQANLVRSIAVDKNNVVWVAADSLLSFNNNEWKMYPMLKFKDRYSNWRPSLVTDIVVDKDNNKWICSSMNGVMVYDDNILKCDLKNSFDESVSSLSIETSGVYWCSISYSVSYGIRRYDGELESVSIPCGVSKNNRMFTTIDSENNKWFGTHKTGIFKYDDIEFTEFNLTNSDLSDLHINCMTFDKNGDLWIGTETKGLCVYNENGVISNVEEHITKPEHRFNISVAPNPVNNNPTISFEISESKSFSIRISDIKGNTIQAICSDKLFNPGNNSVTFDFSNPVKGVYYIEVIDSSNGYSETISIVK